MRMSDWSSDVCSSDLVEVPVVVRVTDARGASAEAQFVIRVADVAPTLDVTGEASGSVTESYTVMLDSLDPGDDVPVEWIIDWGDGSTATRVAGEIGRAHV